MSQIISPGVYTIENDLSQYVSNLSSTIVAMVGTADFGPSETPTLITSAQQFVSIFGNQNPKHYLGYAVQSYLKNGNMVYVTRVAPADSKKAALTMVLPKTATPFAGSWELKSSTDTTATFSVYDPVGVAGVAKTIELDSNTVIPGFDFTDSTGLLPANGKIGSDLKTFIGNTSAITSYITGSSFSITTGAGKNSNAVITGLTTDATSEILVTVNTSKFNSFNSPVTATAVGELGLVSSTPLTPTDIPAVLPVAGTSLAVIGSTKNNTGGNGTLSLVYNVLPTYAGAPATLAALITLLTGTSSPTQLTALDNLLAVTAPDVNGDVKVNISVPLGTVSISQNLAAINAILTSLINAVVTGTTSSLSAYPNLSAAFVQIKAQSASGIVGIGSVDTLGNSKGLKATNLVTVAGLNTAIQLYAITTGATSSFVYNIDSAVVSVINNMVLTGSFTTNIFRPTWDMSAAGSSVVPTYLKFSSIGQGDFSDIALTLNFDPTNTSNGAQVYTVRVYQRQTSPTVATTSVNFNDFTLTESYDGTPETLMSSINGNSQTISLKIDYTTTDTANLTTGTVVSGVPSDYLVIDPVLNTDITGKGYAEGLNFSTQNTTYVNVFGMLLLGGSTGTEVTSYDIVGDPSAKTGIYSFMDPEQIDINLIVAPGWSADPIVAKALLGLCTQRADCMTILDTPFALDVQSVVNFRNNLLNANSNYGALYYPWVQIADTVNKKNIFVPPSGLVASQYAYNDYVGEVYTAPAGRNRGNLLDALATERVLNQGDRDILALNQINPIYNEAGYGTYIRGQMTLQSATTALDRVNVRRLLLYLRKVIATASKYFEFEPGDSITALRLKQLAVSILDDHQRKGAIVSYTVDVGPSVNTALTLDNNELWMSISLTPTKTAEKIIEVFNILGQGQGISIASA